MGVYVLQKFSDHKVLNYTDSMTLPSILDQALLSNLEEEAISLSSSFPEGWIYEFYELYY